MKAGVFAGPGMVEVREWPELTPGPGYVKIKIAYAGICGSDIESFHRHMGFQRVGLNVDGSGPGSTAPGVEGHEASGTIVEVGPGLQRDWKVGQRVAIGIKGACGVCYYCRTKREGYCEHLRWPSGVFAEYALYPEEALWALPDEISFELAALLEPLCIAVHTVDLTGIQNGQTLAITGGGTIGLLCLVVALNAGACKVLVSEPVAGKREMALRMGADMAVDPVTENLATAAARLTDGRGFDAVIEASSNLRAAEQALELVDKGGPVVWAAVYPYDAQIPVKPFQLYLKELTIRAVWLSPYSFHRTLNLLPKLNIGHLVTDIYPLDEIAEAFRNHEKGQSIKTLIKM